MFGIHRLKTEDTPHIPISAKHVADSTSVYLAIIMCWLVSDFDLKQKQKQKHIHEAFEFRR